LVEYLDGAGPATPSFTRIPAGTLTVISPASTAATKSFKFSGYVYSTSFGGTTPQIAFSAAPGGTNQVTSGSYMKITPLGSGTTTQAGPWQ